MRMGFVREATMLIGLLALVAMCAEGAPRNEKRANGKECPCHAPNAACFACEQNITIERFCNNEGSDRTLYPDCPKLTAGSSKPTPPTAMQSRCENRGFKWNCKQPEGPRTCCIAGSSKSTPPAAKQSQCEKRGFKWNCKQPKGPRNCCVKRNSMPEETEARYIPSTPKPQVVRTSSPPSRPPRLTTRRPSHITSTTRTTSPSRTTTRANSNLVGKGWCRPSVCRGAGGSCNKYINGYYKDESNPRECRRACLIEPLCVGYAISNKDYSYPNRCYVYGQVSVNMDADLGWATSRAENFDIYTSSGHDGALCYKIAGREVSVARTDNPTAGQSSRQPITDQFEIEFQLPNANELASIAGTVLDLAPKMVPKIEDLLKEHKVKVADLFSMFLK